MTCNKLKIIKFSFLISIEIILIAIIIFLGRKILTTYQGNVKGVQIVKIDKRYLDFSPLNSDNRQLKYFYEPKPDSVETWNPEWLGYEVKNTINKDGLNERYNYPIEKKKGVYRIITIGDSFTFGHYVNTPENYSEILEDLLSHKIRCKNINRFDVINAGMYGYNAEYTIERFIKRGIKYNPDLVVWLLNEWNLQEIEELILPIDIELTKIGVPIFKEDDGLIKYFRRKIAVEKAYQYVTEDYIYEYQQYVLSRLRTLYNGKLIIFSLFPLKKHDTDIVNNFIFTNNNSEYFNKLFMEFRYSTLYKLPDGHPNRNAHQLIAKNIFDYLYENYFYNCEIN